MNITISPIEKQQLFSAMQASAEQRPLYALRYLSLGVNTIRLLCYSPNALSLVQKQLGYVLRVDAPHYDSTLVVWETEDTRSLSDTVCRQLVRSSRMQVRAEMLWFRHSYPSIMFQDPSTPEQPYIGNLDGVERYLELYDAENRIGYFCHYCFEPERFAKQGHAFVRLINLIVKSDTVNLTHGAVFGYGGNGFLLCGRGKRGKSTLTVESMLQGFEYVSDDYQILEKAPEGLLAYPIYSIITLSPQMYNAMYDRFLGKFVCNNYSLDKYLFNIAAYHSQFRTSYPIKFCLFPEIVADEHPSIGPCSPKEKGRAIVQLIHSTVMQMNDLGDAKTIGKLFSMVCELPFIKLNLCSNIGENTACLRNYLSSARLLPSDSAPPDAQLLDITFGLATVLDTRNDRFVALNKFASNVFLLLRSGTSPTDLRQLLQPYERQNPAILHELDRLIALIAERNYQELDVEEYLPVHFLPEYAQKSDYHLSAFEYIGRQAIELLQ